MEILTQGDWVFFFKETLTTVRINYFSLWLGEGFGRVLLDAGQAPTWSMYGYLAKVFNFNYAVSERIIHFWPIALLTPLCSYLFLNRIFKSRIAVIIGVIVYAFNTYFLTLQIGHLTLMVAFALAPLILLLYLNTLGNKNYVFASLTGIFLFVASAFEPRGFYIIVLIIFLYLFYYLFFINKNLNFKSILRILAKGFIPIAIAGLLNLYWIIGLIKTGRLVSNELFSRHLFGNEFLNINNALTLFHPFWTGAEPDIFVVHQIPLYTWIVPFIAFLGLLTHIKNKIILFFALITLLGIFLTKQVGIPFPNVYPWLYDNFPGFSAFREASKFFFLISLGYSVLVAAFINWVWSNGKRKKLEVYRKYIVSAAIAGIFLLNAKPYITGDIKRLTVPRHVPSDYLIVNDFILEQNDFSRTLWVPNWSRWSIYTDIHPRISAVQIIESNLSDTIVDVSNSEDTIGEKVINTMKQPTWENYLDLSSIKYVFVPLEDNANDDNFYKYYGGYDKEFYIDALDNLDYLSKVDIGTEEIVVYENEAFRPHIYTTKAKETIKKVVPYEGVEYTSVNPTEYLVKLDNVTRPLYLNFSESYHLGWKVRVGEFSWFSSLVQNSYFISDSSHTKNDAMLNSFYIDPKIVCKEFNCTQNEDGSYDMQITLFFRPQAYMYLGGIISLTTLAGILGYLGYKLVKFLKMKDESKTKSRKPIT